LRITIGRFTSEEDIDYTIEKIHEAVAKLRELSPLWDMYKEGVDISQVKWAAH
ncbi:MAG: IscS subfamily cysteine desulfurase, partial [Pseudohongiellaceae bacterium]